MNSAHHFEPSASVEETQARRLANLFLTVALVFGLLFIFLEPPLVIPDENAHFANICRISRGGFFADVENGKTGCYISDEEVDFLLFQGGVYNGPDNTNRFNVQILHHLTDRPHSDRIIFYPTEHAELNPFAYLIASFAVAVMRLLTGGLNAYNSYLVAKIANLIFFALAVRWAIIKTGAMRHTMFLLAVMPMTLFLGASTSYDAILIPAAFLLFAYATKILCSGPFYRISNEDITCICLSCALLFGVKVAYVPLILILLSIPVRKFGGWKKWGLCVGIVAAMGVVTFVLPSFIGGLVTADVNREMTALQVQQQEYFKENFMRFPIIVLQTVKFYFRPWIYEFVGVLGWLDTYFPMPLIYVYLLLLIFTAVTELCDIRGIRVSTRLLSLAGVLIFFLGTVYTMYVKWNPVLTGIVGGDIAYGGQGRYFIPVFLFVVIQFANPLMQKWKCAQRLREVRERILPAAAYCSAGCTALLLLLRYWV